MYWIPTVRNGNGGSATAGAPCFLSGLGDNVLQKHGTSAPVSTGPLRRIDVGVADRFEKRDRTNLDALARAARRPPQSDRRMPCAPSTAARVSVRTEELEDQASWSEPSADVVHRCAMQAVRNSRCIRTTRHGSDRSCRAVNFAGSLSFRFALPRSPSHSASGGWAGIGRRMGPPDVHS